MIIALYIPEELVESYRKERFQPTLEKFKRWARQGGTPADLKIARQLEASFCVSRQIVKNNGAVPLVGPSFPESKWELENLKEDK